MIKGSGREGQESGRDGEMCLLLDDSMQVVRAMLTCVQPPHTCLHTHIYNYIHPQVYISTVEAKRYPVLGLQW